MNERTKAIGFRLSVSHLRLLREEAAKLGLSPGSYARLLVVQAITGADRLRLLDELGELKKSVSGIREDLGNATIALLADAGRATQSEAEDFVKTSMGRK